MSGATFEVEAAARGDLGGVLKGAPGAEKTALDVKTAGHDLDNITDESTEVLVGPNGEQYPTKEELTTLRRIHGHTSWVLYTIGCVHAQITSLYISSNTPTDFATQFRRAL